MSAGRDDRSAGAGERRVIGIDGGGTKTVAWLARVTNSGETETIGRGYSGASNCRAVGLPTATANLRQAIEAAFADASAAPQTVDSICFGLAGADRDIERGWITEWASEQSIARLVQVSNDAVPILHAAAGQGRAVALIAGTGSLAIGRRADGTILRCGGWGRMFGDEGSGYQIALAALRAAARAEDGRAGETALLPAILQHFEITSLSEVVPIVYADDFPRTEIARLAPLVFEIAAQGDVTAADIVAEAAFQLAELVATIARQLQIDEQPLPIGLTGGILIHQASLREQLQLELKQQGVAKPQFTLVPEPVAGAVKMAAQAVASTTS